MSNKPSTKTKELRKMGQGEGADYIPYIRTSEFNSLGTTSVIKDWKTGREVHCLSQGEALWYYILRWDDNNIDIREQYPLDNKIVNTIVRKSGMGIFRDDEHRMTTDFLVTERDDSLHAYAVKTDRNVCNCDRVLADLCIEKLYWVMQGCRFDILFKEDANTVLAANIRLVTEFYDPDNVFDLDSTIKHKIAIKEWTVDMGKETLTVPVLREILEAHNG